MAAQTAYSRVVLMAGMWAPPLAVHWEPRSELRLAARMVAWTAESKVESMAATKAAMKADKMVV